MTTRDFHGDPLPPGAVARLGTVRFRHDTPIVFAAFLQGGKQILSVSDDGVLHVWEFPSGRDLRRLDGLAGPAPVTAATLSPDGKHLTAFGGDGFLHIWDWANGKEIGKVAQAGPGPRPLPGTGPATGEPIYSPDGKTLLVFGGSRVLQLVDLPTARDIGPGPGHTDPLVSLWFTPDGRQVVTKDGKATHTWDATTGKGQGAVPVTLPPNPGSPTVISPDGRVGVTVGRFGTAVEAKAAKARDAVLFDTATGKELGTIALDADWLPLYRMPLAFSPDGKVLATVAADAQQQPQIHLYGVPGGALLRALDPGPAAAAPAAGFKGAGGGFGGFGKGLPFGLATQKLLFAPDGKALAYQAGPRATIAVLDTTTGKLLATLQPPASGTTMQGTFSPDGRCLALENRDGTVALVELATGRPRCTFGSKSPPAPLKANALDDLVASAGLTAKSKATSAISPDGRLLALAGADGAVRVWDVLTGQELAVLTGHRVAVNALAFAPGGKALASASDDTTALIWDVTGLPRPVPPGKAATQDDLGKWWQALAAEDAAEGFAAVRAFAAVPEQAVAWISARVKPAQPLDGKRAEELIKQLDDDQFDARDRASDALFQMGELTLPVLDKALAGSLAAETRRRLEQVRGKLTEPGLRGDRLRVFRAVEVLERIGTPQARAVLQALAGGAPGALVTTSAQAVLNR
jgi:WD40 repeat protein